ncbi:aldehyde dehydrogenase family protein [Demequina sp. SO4-13]|uniref:aldehyde dehydrogenase family protein n=1 Tax=Demequina sp. SO4-13 TaxID=3401027 RepID=UPI003AF7D4A7
MTTLTTDNPDHGTEHTILDPRDGSVVGTVHDDDESLVPHVIEQSRSAQRDWARVEPAERGNALIELARILEAHSEELADLNTAETGRSPMLARAGVDAAVATLRQYAEIGPLHAGGRLRGDPAHIDTQTPEPRGVVVALTPWNDPIAIAAGLVGAALVTGNTVIHKPSERCPHLGRRWGELVSQVLPPHVCQTVTGGPVLGDALTRAPGADVIAHVGSSLTGERIARAAALTGVHVVRENGGNDPLLIDEDVDPRWAAAQTALGALINGGQLCTAVERVFVHQAIEEPYLDALADEAEAFARGEMWGPLVDERLRDTVHEHVADALAAGARALTGAEVPEGAGTYYPPTVLANCEPSMRVMTEETFGPVVPVMAVHDLDHAVALANDDEYGLAATILSGSLQRTLTAAHALEFGTVKVNDVFGGAPGGSAEPRRRSGTGLGYGPGLLEEFTAQKVLHVEPLPATGTPGPRDTSGA